MIEVKLSRFLFAEYLLSRLGFFQTKRMDKQSKVGQAIETKGRNIEKIHLRH
jgi:hypothetical protein